MGLSPLAANAQSVSECPTASTNDPAVRNAPTVFRGSDTVDVNQMVQFFGDSMNSASKQVTAMGWSIPDAAVSAPATAPALNTTGGTCLTVSSASATTAKLQLPVTSTRTASFGPKLGLYAIQLGNGSGASSVQYLNRAEPWWVLGTINDTTGTIYPAMQGGTGDTLITGQNFRVFGRNLYASSQMQGWLQGNGRTCLLTYQLASSNNWEATFQIPLSCGLSAGNYTLSVHNGMGGQYGFGKTLPVVVAAAPANWPTTTFNVKTYGAAGNGVANDTAAFQSALAAAASNGGGIVAVPPGTYNVSSLLTIPAKTQFLGTGANQTQTVIVSTEIGWYSILAGNGNFNVQNMTLQTSTAHRGITCPAVNAMYNDYGVIPAPSTPCGNVLVDHVTITQNTPTANFNGAHDGVGAIHLYGNDVTVQNSTIAAIGSAPTLMWNAHHVVLSNNIIYNGDPNIDGYYGADQCVYEGNTHQASPGSQGNAVYVEGSSHYLYVANNLIQNSFGTFGEGFVSGDQPYGADWMGTTNTYHTGTNVVSDPATVTIANAGWTANQFAGEVVYVTGGTGALQRNYVVSNTTDTLTFASLWQIPVDSSSVLDLVKDHSEGIFYNNSFKNVSVSVELYTQSYGFVVDSNSMTDAGGSYCLGWNEVQSSGLSAVSPMINICYFNSWTNNQMSGSLNDSTNPNSNSMANTSVIGPQLDPSNMDTPSPILGWVPPIVGNEVRGNTLSSVASGTGWGNAVIGGIYNSGQTAWGCMAIPMPMGGATDTLVDSNTINGAKNPIMFWPYYGNTVLWNNKYDQGTVLDYSFTNCTPASAIATPNNAQTIAGSATITALAQGRSSATISSVQFQLDATNVMSPVTTAPYTAVMDSTKYAAGQHFMNAIVTDSNGSKTTSVPVIITVNQSATTSPVPPPPTAPSSPAPTGTALVTSFSPSNPRNNYNGFVGMQFTVGARPITVSALGRVNVSGNSTVHTVKLVQASNGADVAGGSAQVTVSGTTAGLFGYAALTSPLTLSANTTYYLVSQETYGGDKWYDIGSVAATTDVTIGGPVYYGGASFVPVPGLTNQSYVPVNLLYSVSASQSTVSVTAPTSGATLSGNATFTAAANGGTGLTIAQVQFQIDGANVGQSVTTSPYSTSISVSTLANGTHAVTAVATDSANNQIVSSPVSVTVSNASAAPVVASNAFITSYNPGNLRSDYNGWVGTKITVGASPITVTSLGRINVSGNSQAHSVKLVNATTGADVTGGTAQVLMSSATAGQFSYAALSSPIVLAANTSYYLVSQESWGGDQWYNMGTVIAASNASVMGAVYYDGRSFILVPGTSNQSYVPVNMLYTLPGSQVTVTAPTAGATVSGSAVTLTASATAASGKMITQVQFQIDGANAGKALTTAPYTTSVSVASLTNGAHNVTAIATDSQGNTTTSLQVSITVHNTANTPITIAPVAGPFVTGYNPGSARNNYTGWVGMEFNVGATPIKVTSLGRLNVPGNLFGHTLKLVQVANGADVPGASVTVTMTPSTAGQFAYGTLTAPVTLAANTAYYLVSQETYGGDQWYNIGGVNTTTAASVLCPTYHSGTAFVPVSGLPNQSYVPMNMLYTTGSN